MKLFFAILVYLIPTVAIAQSVWEKPEVNDNEPRQKEQVKAVTADPDAKYLGGAVPMVDGKIEWQLDVDVPGKSADEIYGTMLQYLTALTKSDNQLEGSCVALVNKTDHIIAANVREWLVFTDKLLALDRAKFYYTVIAYCKDGHLTVTLGRISYRYEDGGDDNDGTLYKAEEWINDENALNKKKTKMYRGPKKFRKKTIDRKDYLFDSIKKAVLK